MYHRILCISLNLMHYTPYISPTKYCILYIHSKQYLSHNQNHILICNSFHSRTGSQIYIPNSYLVDSCIEHIQHLCKQESNLQNSFQTSKQNSYLLPPSQMTITSFAHLTSTHSSIHSLLSMPYIIKFKLTKYTGGGGQKHLIILKY